VDVLVRHLPADALTAGERRTIDEFIELRDDVERAKGEFRKDEGGVGSGVNVDRFLSSLDRLRNTDPRAYATAVRRLRDGLADDDDTT
jgi:hypothetical protein